MIEISTSGRGVVLRVRAAPGAKKNELRGEHRGALKVSVTQAPEKGKANKAIIEVLCAALGLRKSQVTLIAGETSPDKQLLIEGLSAEDLSQAIQAALGGEAPGKRS